MATLKIDGPDGKTYSVDVPEGSAPEAVAEQFAAEMWPNAKTDTGLTAIKNTADIAGAGVGAALAGTGELARSVMKEPPKLGQRLYEEFWGGKKNVPKSAKEAIGRFIPVDPAERAKELGVPLTPNREALARGAEYLTGAASLGAPAKMAGLAGAGGAIGQRTAGDEGAVAMGLALPLIGIRATAPRVTPTATKDKIKVLAQDMFDASEKSGVILSQRGFAQAVNDLGNKMAGLGLDKMNHPLAFRAFERLAQDAQRGHLTPKHWHTLRQVIDRGPGAASFASPAGSSERMFAGVMRNAMDDYLDIVRRIPGGIVQGNPSGISELQRGIHHWRKYRGLQRIEDAVEAAKNKASTYTAAGYDTALRNEFKRLVNNPKEMKFFSKPEQAALRKVARGGPIANTFRQLSRLSPRNLLYTYLGAQINPAAQAALATTGLGSQFAATGLTKRNIKLAQDLIARGHPIPPNLRRYLDAAPAAGGVLAGQGSRTTQ